MNQLQPKSYANKLSWCFGVVMTLLLAGCNSGDKDPILAPDGLTGLTQIVVNPTNPTVPSGLNQQFEALGVFANGTSVNISQQVIWSSATPVIATINTSGMVRAISNGTSLISATVAGKTGQTMLTVTDAALVSINLAPLTSTASAGVKVQFGATGVYSNGTSQDLTRSVLWTSSDQTIVSFNPNQQLNSGLASALLPGVTNVNAAMGAVNASTSLTVTAASLTTLVISPANPTIIAGLTQQMTVTGTFNNGNSVDLTSQAIWLSADTTRLSFNPNGVATSGIASAVAAGTVAVSASFGGMLANSNVEVTSPALTALNITPTSATVAAGNRQQLIATGVYNNGTTANITAQVTWASSDTTIAFLNANGTADSGLVTTVIPGNTTITASIEQATGSLVSTSNLTVSNAVVTSLRITPNTPLLINGFSQQFIATVVYSDQSTKNVTSNVIWSSADTSIVTLNPSGMPNSGLATPLLAGNVTITATLDEATSSNTLVSVVDAALTSIVIAPIAPSLAAGTSKQLTATGTFSNGSTMLLTHLVDWQTTNTSVATFNPNFMANSGLLSAIVLGTTDVTASLHGIQASTAVIATAATLVSVAIAPQTPAMTSGQVLQLQLIGTYTDNSVADVAANAVWSSSNTSVATFNPNQQANSGLLSALAAGTTTLSATFTNIELQTFDSSTTLTVTGALATNPQAPELGVIAGFVLAASQGISTTAGSTIANGDVAIIDGNRAAFVGFTPGANVGHFNELTNGLSYAKDDLNPPYLVPLPFTSTADFLSELKVNLLSVSTYLVGLNPAANTTTLDGPELGGLNLNRGVYHLIGDASVSQGSLNLDAQGDPNSVFIISITGNLSTATTGNILLLNGAQASNVFWRIGGTTTIGANNQFAGNVVSTQNIQLQTGATIQGRLISIAGNIQLDANSISKAL